MPLIGQIQVGLPIETFPKITSVTVPALFVNIPENSYAFQIRGDALLNDHICDGDLIIVEATQEPQPGELVLALIRNQESIIKRYYPEGLYIRLEAPHSSALPMTVRNDEINVQGIILGMLRWF